MRTTRVGRRLLAALLLSVLIAGCRSSPSPELTPTPSATPSPSPNPSVVRTVTPANLITASEVPKLPLGGTVKAYAKSARPADEISVCEQDPARLRATSSVQASYRQQADGQTKTPLRNKPNVYVLALQFGSPAAAVQARETWRSWLNTCRTKIPTRTGFEAVERGFDWQEVQVSAGNAEVAEIAYRPQGSKTAANYWESTGLTVVEDRMMVTVYLFYSDESLYNMDPNDDEGGFRHPQLKLTQAAAKRLAR